MALDHAIEALAAQAESERARRMLRQMLRQIRALADRERIRAYQRLFLDADGNLKADAVAVLADLGAVARLGVADPPSATEAELRTMAGRRGLALHILARLDLSGEKLRKLAVTIRENRHE